MSEISILSPITSTFLIVTTRLYFKHASEFTSIRKNADARQIIRWMMYFTIFTDILDQLRMMTSVSPYYFLDYLFSSWLPFYYDLKLFCILYSSVKLDKLFNKPKSDTEIDLKKWQEKWVKNYVKWMIFWILYGVFHVVDLMVELDDDDDSGFLYQMVFYAISVVVFFSKQILKLCSGFFTTILFKYLVKPFIGKHEDKIDLFLENFEVRVQESEIFKRLQRIFHWYIKRWKEVKVIAKDVKKNLKNK